MRKIFSFLAIAAAALMMASCGDEPESKGFKIQIEALSTKVHVVVTAQKQNAYFVSIWDEKSVVEESGGVQQRVEQLLAEADFDDLQNANVIVQNEDEYTENVAADREYVVYVCYVEKGEDGHGKIIGDVAFKEFKTMPVFTLPGEFTVDKNGKKVHFRSSNMFFQYGTYMFTSYQYLSYSSNVSQPIDLFDWAKTERDEAAEVLTADAWYYLFRTRSNAEKLFAHATLGIGSSEIKGLILLPDNWKTPEDIELTTGFDMGVQWEAESGIYVNREDNFNAYQKNIFTKEQWESLEFAGAVFLPAAGYVLNGSIRNVGTAGYYWSLSNGESGAYSFSFSGNSLNVLDLKEGTNKIKGYSIRPVVVVE